MLASLIFISAFSIKASCSLDQMMQVLKQPELNNLSKNICLDFYKKNQSSEISITKSFCQEFVTPCFSHLHDFSLESGEHYLNGQTTEKSILAKEYAITKIALDQFSEEIVVSEFLNKLNQIIPNTEDDLSVKCKETMQRMNYYNCVVENEEVSRKIAMNYATIYKHDISKKLNSASLAPGSATAPKLTKDNDDFLKIETILNREAFEYTSKVRDRLISTLSSSAKKENDTEESLLARELIKNLRNNDELIDITFKAWSMSNTTAFNAQIITENLIKKIREKEEQKSLKGLDGPKRHEKLLELVRIQMAKEATHFYCAEGFYKNRVKKLQTHKNVCAWAEDQVLTKPNLIEDFNKTMTRFDCQGCTKTKFSKMYYNYFVHDELCRSPLLADNRPDANYHVTKVLPRKEKFDKGKYLQKLASQIDIETQRNILNYVEKNNLGADYFGDSWIDVKDVFTSNIKNAQNKYQRIVSGDSDFSGERLSNESLEDRLNDLKTDFEAQEMLSAKKIIKNIDQSNRYFNEVRNDMYEGSDVSKNGYQDQKNLIKDLQSSDKQDSELLKANSIIEQLKDDKKKNEINQLRSDMKRLEDQEKLVKRLNDFIENDHFNQSSQSRRIEGRSRFESAASISDVDSPSFIPKNTLNNYQADTQAEINDANNEEKKNTYIGSDSPRSSSKPSEADIELIDPFLLEIEEMLIQNKGKSFFIKENGDTFEIIPVLDSKGEFVYKGNVLIFTKRKVEYVESESQMRKWKEVPREIIRQKELELLLNN